jgi:hypothetical protein
MIDAETQSIRVTDRFDPTISCAKLGTPPRARQVRVLARGGYLHLLCQRAFGEDLGLSEARSVDENVERRRDCLDPKALAIGFGVAGVAAPGVGRYLLSAPSSAEPSRAMSLSVGVDGLVRLRGTL